MSQKRGTKPKEVYIIINRKQKCPVPINSPFLHDIRPSISNELLIKYKYKIHSKVSLDVLQSFIYQSISRKVPEIDDQNFIEYEELSKEFDLMNDLIELYRPFLPILKQKQINKKLKEIPSFKLRQLQEDYQSNIRNHS